MPTTKKTLHTSQHIDIDEHYEKWIDYLCSYGNRLEYQQVLHNSKNAVFATMKYRRLLRSRGLGNVSFIVLNTAYIQKNYIKLHSLLQELFLETISKDQLQFILNKIDSTGNGMLKLYDRHMQDKNTRILSIALTL